MIVFKDRNVFTQLLALGGTTVEEEHRTLPLDLLSGLYQLEVKAVLQSGGVLGRVMVESNPVIVGSHKDFSEMPDDERWVAVLNNQKTLSSDFFQVVKISFNAGPELNATRREFLKFVKKDVPGGKRYLMWRGIISNFDGILTAAPNVEGDTAVSWGKLLENYKTVI
jgi:hypothetical protein